MRWYQKVRTYLGDITSELLTAILVLIISLIVGWDKKEGFMILGIAVLIPLMKLATLITTKSPYEKLKDRIDGVVDDIAEKAYVLQPTNLLVDFKPPLLRRYLDQKITVLQKRVNGISKGEALTKCSAGELYEIIRFMTERAETIYSIDIAIERWFSIFSQEDYRALEYEKEEAKTRIKEIEKSKALDGTLKLYEINKKRLTSGELTAKRIFSINRDDIRNKECLWVLVKMYEIEKEVGKTKLETRILVKEDLTGLNQDIYNQLEDVVIFDEEISIKESVGHEIGHRVAFSSAEVDRDKKDFFSLWDGIPPVDIFLDSSAVKDKLPKSLTE